MQYAINFLSSGFSGKAEIPPTLVVQGVMVFRVTEPRGNPPRADRQETVLISGEKPPAWAASGMVLSVAQLASGACDVAVRFTGEHRVTK